MALNGPLMKFIDSKRTDLPFELSASNGNYISRCLLKLKGCWRLRTSNSKLMVNNLPCLHKILSTQPFLGKQSVSNWVKMWPLNFDRVMPKTDILRSNRASGFSDAVCAQRMRLPRCEQCANLAHVRRHLSRQTWTDSMWEKFDCSKEVSQIFPM